MKTIILICLLVFANQLYAQQNNRTTDEYTIPPNQIVKFYHQGDNDSKIYLFDTNGLGQWGLIYLRHFLKYTTNSFVTEVKTHANTTVISVGINRDTQEESLVVRLRELLAELQTIRAEHPKDFESEIERRVYAHKLTIWKKKDG